jgi:hypothetical protein
MAKLQGEVSGATQVQQHADNENRSADTALPPWTVQLLIDGKSEENGITA